MAIAPVLKSNRSPDAIRALRDIRIHLRLLRVPRYVLLPFVHFQNGKR